MSSINYMLSVDCREIGEIKNDLLVYVADNISAIPTIQSHGFALSSIDDTIIDKELVVTEIKSFFDSINARQNFAVISNDKNITIKALTDKKFHSEPTSESLFTCTHCSYITPYEVDYNNHVKIHYL